MLLQFSWLSFNAIFRSAGCYEDTNLHRGLLATSSMKQTALCIFMKSVLVRYKQVTSGTDPLPGILLNDVTAVGQHRNEKCLILSALPPLVRQVMLPQSHITVSCHSHHSLLETRSLSAYAFRGDPRRSQFFTDTNRDECPPWARSGSKEAPVTKLRL